jgi:hypothetical protein
MPKDILTKIVEQKQKEISKARSVVSEKNWLSWLIKEMISGFF